MLTPPNVTREELWEALKNDAPTHIRITQFNTTYTDNDIVASGIDIRHYLNADQDLVIGKSMMSEVSFEMFAETFMNSFSIGSFTLEIGVEINGTTEWIMIGTYKPVEPQKYIDAQTVTVYAYDNMSKFDVPAEDWLKSLTYPMTVRQMFESLCSYVGVTGEVGNALTNMLNRSFSEPPITNLGVMCRDVLEAIAEACGCYAKITAGGNCRLVWYARPKNGNLYYSYTVSNDEIFQRSAISMTMSIGGLNVKNTEDDVGVLYPSTATSNIYVIVDNPFLKTATSAEETSYIVPLYNRLRDSNIERNPIDVTCVGNPLVEVGDVINVAIMDESYDFVMPIFTKETHWDGGLTDRYQFTGRANRQSYTNNVKQKLAEGGRFHIFKNDIDQLYSEIADAEDNITIVDQKADSIALSAGKKARMWYSNTAPTGTTSEPLVANVDYWINTSDNRKLMRWTGSAWAAADDISKYTKYSGIDITQNGVDITGSKYVKIQSGGSFQLDTPNLKINSADSELKCYSWVLNYSGLLLSNSNNGVLDASLRISTDAYYVGQTKTPLKIATAIEEGIYYDAISLKLGATDVNDDIAGVKIVKTRAGYVSFCPCVDTQLVSCDLGSAREPFPNLYANNIRGSKVEILNENIQFKGTKATTNMIRFLDNTEDAYGNGIAIGGGGIVVIGAGESSSTYGSGHEGEENLYLMADVAVRIITNVQDRNNQKTFLFDTNGDLHIMGKLYANNPGTEIIGETVRSTNVRATKFYLAGTEVKTENLWGGMMQKTYSKQYTIAANGDLDLTANDFGFSTPADYIACAVALYNSGSPNCIMTALDIRQTGTGIVAHIKNFSGSQWTPTAYITVLYIKPGVA